MMSQLRGEMTRAKLQSQKSTSISNLQNQNNLDLFEDESRSISENEASENDEDQESSEDIELTWRTTIQHWIDLVNEEISDDIDQDDYDITFNIPTSESVYPAHDQNSKWRLSELFPEGLEAPNFINNNNINNIILVYILI